MSSVDIVLFVILAGFFFSAWRQGFIVALGNLVGSVVGYFAAKEWSGWAAQWLSQWLHWNKGIVHIIAFLLVFLVAAKLFGLLVWFINKTFKVFTFIPLLSTINGLLGGALGAIEGVLLIGSATYVIRLFQLHPKLLMWISQSTIAKYAEGWFVVALKFFKLV